MLRDYPLAGEHRATIWALLLRTVEDAALSLESLGVAARFASPSLGPGLGQL